jgi:hypothetical protein
VRQSGGRARGEDREDRFEGWKVNESDDAETETVHSQYDALLKAGRTQNDELRRICSNANESALGTERHHCDSLRKVNALERELNQMTQQLHTANPAHYSGNEVSGEMGDVRADSFANFFDARKSFHLLLFSTTIN